MIDDRLGTAGEGTTCGGDAPARKSASHSYRNAPEGATLIAFRAGK